MNPLKIEVTEAMREAAVDVVAGEGIHDCGTDTLRRVIGDALTAAFQHPEFIAQIRRQVVDALPPPEAHVIGPLFGAGWAQAIKSVRASIGRLLGEEDHG